MRDKKYIMQVLNELGRIWEAYPDKSFGELLMTFAPNLSYNDDELISIMKTNIYLNLVKEYKNGEAR